MPPPDLICARFRFAVRDDAAIVTHGMDHEQLAIGRLTNISNQHWAPITPQAACANGPGKVDRSDGSVCASSRRRWAADDIGRKQGHASRGPL